MSRGADAERILILVQHLWGIGHVARAFALAQALAGRGAAVTVTLGGPPTGLPSPPGVDCVQLAPLRAGDAAYRGLVDADDRPVGEALWAARRATLLATLDRVRPTCLVTEHFPFGRRKQRAEYGAVLEAAAAQAPRPRIFASVRDILEDPLDPRRRAGQIALLARFYDGVLVHGDPAFLPLERSLPPVRIVCDALHYTGYVHRPVPVPALTPMRQGILVSAGGGRDGAALSAAVADIHRRGRQGAHPWTVVLGKHAPARPEPIAGVEIVEHVADFPALLAQCAVSVSRAGYNTVAESLAARAPMVLVPLDRAGEREQALRAEAFAAAGRAILVPERHCGTAGDLPARLAAAVEMALDTRHAGLARPLGHLDHDGAQRTADVLLSR